MPNIKLFVDAHVFDSEFQGSRTFIKELYTALYQLSPPFDIYLGAYNLGNLEKEFNSCPGFQFIKYRTKNRYVRWGYEIPAIIEKHRFDYAHFQYFNPLKKNCRFITTIHDVLFLDFPEDFPWGYRTIRKVLCKRSGRTSDILTTVSEYSKSRIALHFNIQESKIAVLPNGIDGTRLQVDKDRESIIDIKNKIGGGKYILYVSRIEPRKNHDLLLRSYLNLKLWEKGIKLVFIGVISLQNLRLETLLKNLPLKIRENIFHFENVSNAELSAFYQNAALFVYPSKAEGFGIPPLEAAYYKVPVICSSATAMSDFSFLGDGLFNPDIPDELEAKIKQHLIPGKEGKLDEINKNILEKYSWVKSAKRFMDLLLENVKHN